MKKLLITAGILVFSLSGCVHQPIEKSTIAPIWEEKTLNIIRSDLSESAEIASRALDRLSKIEMARTTPAVSPLSDKDIVDELGRKATVNYVGPAEGLLRSLATKIGYSFYTLGNPPSNPILVTVSVKDKVVAKVFESVGVQTHPFATVILNANEKSITLRYDLGGIR